MGILIDSSILIAFERERKDLSCYIEGREEEELFLSVISASELLHGVHRATTPRIRAKRLAFVEGVLASIPLMDIDLAIARSHAQLWSDLAKQGRMIGLHDSWIAATCLAHGLKLVTANTEEFGQVPGLEVEEWN
ncbi:MAG: type II toxin-antitoxin system VapC family toxin [Kiritimatiellae bacterium]|nr:type II toxin-antitoxin system VapC family toxin [Kiritimatiellia bacterium]